MIVTRLLFGSLIKNWMHDLRQVSKLVGLL